MTLVLSSLGLSAGASVRASGHGTRAQATSLFAASSFGTMLGGQPDALGVGDPLAALTALVQNGTSTATVISTLSNQIADSVQQTLPEAQLGSGASRTQLVDSITAALSPPGTAPPGATAAQQVAALARRLQTWIGGVAREANRAGQQNERTGHVLDANTAKELPAQQDSKTTASGVDASALARSLLADVVAALSATPGTSPAGTSTAPRSTAPAVPASAAPISARAAAALARSAIAKLPAHAAPGESIALPASDPASGPATAPPADVAALATIAPATTPPATTPPATVASLPGSDPGAAPAHPAPAGPPAPAAVPTAGDLLARMLVRAAGVDARVNPAPARADASAQADAPATPAAAAAVRSPDGGPPVQQSAIDLNRLTALLTDAVGAARPDGESSSQNGGTTSRDPNADAGALPSPVSLAPAKTAGATQAPATAFAVPAAPPAATTPATAQAAPPAPLPPSVDPNAVVEQVVKSMAMRSNTNGTSEMRLRLQPDQLGTVTLKLTVDGSSVSATALAQNADVRSALLAHQHQLVKSLAESGMKLTSFSVDISGGDTGNDRQRDRTSGFGRHYSVHEVAGAQDGSEPSESSSAGPALLPGSTVALFSYLA